MAFTSAGYVEWKRHHCALLCISHADYNKMLNEMEFLFRRMSATVDEMDAATIWLWERPHLVEKDWGTHGGMLRAEIYRARQRAREERERADRAASKPGKPLNASLGKIGTEKP